MKKFLTAAAITLGITFAAASPAAAHHTSVSCTNRQTATWTIVNSEADKALTFTTDRGHIGSIPAGGLMTVQYAGFSLTVAAKWSNGQTATNVGSGNCVPDQPTTTTETPPSTTTLPPSTTSSSTTNPPTTTTPTTSAPPSSVSSTVPETTVTFLPDTTTIPATSSTTSAPSSPTTTTDIGTPPDVIVTCEAEDGSTVPCTYWDTPPTAPPAPTISGELPETGNQHMAGFALLGGGLLILGGVLRRMVRRAS